jgi:hypothetical protein
MWNTIYTGTLARMHAPVAIYKRNFRHIKTTQENLSLKAINVIYTFVAEFLQNQMNREARIVQLV